MKGGRVDGRVEGRNSNITINIIPVPQLWSAGACFLFIRGCVALVCLVGNIQVLHITIYRNNHTVQPR